MTSVLIAPDDLFLLTGLVIAVIGNVAAYLLYRNLKKLRREKRRS